MRSPLAIFLTLLAFSGCLIAHRGVEDFDSPSSRRVEEPHVASVEDGALPVTWAVVNDEGRADIFLSFLDPEGCRWSPPRRLNRVRQSAVAGRQVGPRVARSHSGAVAVAWVDRARDPFGDLVVASSADGGSTFSRARRVNDDRGGARGQEYHDITYGPDDELLVVWLDERDAPHDDRNRKQLYFAASRDGGRRFSPNRALTASDGGVCPCCRPAVAVGEGGDVHVAYRDREGDSLFVRMRTRRRRTNAFSPAVTVSRAWRFPGCPVNGPALAAGPGGKVWALWVEGDERGAALSWARSDDGARTFDARGSIESRWASSPSGLSLAPLAGGERGPVAVWATGFGRICIVVLPAGVQSASSVPSVVAGGDLVGARSPSIATSGAGAILCWVEEFWAGRQGAAAVPRAARFVPPDEPEQRAVSATSSPP